MTSSEEERMVSFDSDEKTYNLKFRKTNQGTSINLKPIVKERGDRGLGQVLSEGYATQNGN
jgi:DNA-directed RNA polymerase subunit beta